MKAAKIRTLTVVSVLLFAPACASNVPDAVSISPSAESPADDTVDVRRGLGGGGPARATYSMDNAADHVTLNSFTNSTYGDERNFTRIKNKDDANSSYTDELEVEVGKSYTVALMYRNSASSAVNTPSEDTAVRVLAPASFVGAAEIHGFVSASNAKPSKVWDSAVITLPDPDAAVALRYVPGTAIIHSSGKVDGLSMPETLFTTGAPVGCDELDGRLEGGNPECTGYVTFDLTLDQPNFTVSMLGTPSADNAILSPAIQTKIGEIIEVRVEYKNTGTTQQDNVVLRLNDLPAGMEIVTTSLRMSHGRSNGYERLPQQSAINFTRRGINVGSYAPRGGNCFVKFSLRITEVPGHDFSTNGQIFVYPGLSAETANGTKKSGMKVLVFGPLQ